MRKVKSGGGWPAIRYTLKKSRQAGGVMKMYRALRTRNACKTCALGMGGQRGGMVNEKGHFPEVCKKSLQAMAADMQGAIEESFWKTYSVAQLQKFTPRQLEECGRLSQPLRLSGDRQYYEPVSWETAIASIVGQLDSQSADQAFFYFSGRSSNEAGFLLQLFARMYGTNNVNNCSYYCHQASGVGLTSAIGSGTATVVLEDLEKCDTVFLIGGNPASNHPRMMTSLMKLRRRGGQVVVINPVVETGLVNFRVPSDVRSLFFGSEIASQYVQPHIGGDLALLNGISKQIVESAAHDESYLRSQTDGWQEWLEHLENLEWDEIVEKSGVTQDVIREIADCYSQSKSTIFSWTMGITHHEHGVQNVQAIANLALLRGMVGRPHCGLMPIRGHSNVQGIGSVGATPKLKDAIFKNLQSNYGLKLPDKVGRDTLSCMEGAAKGELKSGFCLGGNLYGSNPDSKFAGESIGRLDQIVYLSTTLNTGHFHGIGRETFILPVQARDEESQATTQESMFNFVRMSDGGKPRLEGPRSEVDVIAEIAERTIGSRPPVNWLELNQTNAIRQMIGDVVPGFEKIKAIGETGEEFQIAGRTYHQPGFNTPSGRAQIHSHELPKLKGSDQQLRLMTVRSEGQFNTVVYEEEDLYRGQTHRNVVLVNPQDIDRLGLKASEYVRVVSETGCLERVELVSFQEIKSGNALMYFPEANILVSRQVDPKSRTPAFKGVLITLESAG